MPAGKLAAQAGHAFLESYLSAERQAPSLCARYRASGLGTKVVLVARHEDELRACLARAAACGLPHALITDSGHVLPPFFDGSPVVTALGLGPATRAQVHHITRRLKCA